MRFANSHLMIFSEEIDEAIHQFSLNADGILVESFNPGETAIMVEESGGKKFRLHLDLQDSRIIAAKQLGVNKSELHDFDRYLVYMK
ncbi:MAG: hypothetical protein H6696_04905 [Deferribacteres bacterium]|nr:hypothetical protein [candidate division KSB1 bacterium]MCB9501255.1 hypothetical protein [Deferribacteres bacterium]